MQTNESGSVQADLLRISTMLPISIVIATYNRCDDLRLTLGAINQHQASEIIVVNNGSTDATQKMVSEEFPLVTLINLPDNRGVPGFNVGVQKAREPFVFLLDDDAVPQKEVLQKAIDVFEKSPKVAVVACHILDVTETPVTRNWSAHPLCFWGCGAAIRKSSLEGQPFMFDPKLFLHGTEMDLSIRLYAAGYWLQYVPDAVVHHRFSEQNRSQGKRIYFLTQSAVRFAIKYLPFYLIFPALSRHLILLGWRSWQHACVKSFILGVIEAARTLPSISAERQPVPARVSRIYYRQVWEYEPLSYRVCRFICGRPRSREHFNEGFHNFD
jgi:GT2 family glycosyltransferase